MNRAASQAEAPLEAFENRLRSLQMSMWIRHPGTAREPGWREECGSLSASEADELLELVRAHRLPATLTSVGFGFGRIGLVIYNDPPFPGIDPEVLFVFSENHLDKGDFPWVKTPTEGRVHDEAWAFFSYVREPENMDKLRYHGLETPTREQLEY